MKNRLMTVVVIAALAMPMQSITGAYASGRGPCSEDRYDVRPRMGPTVVHRKVRHLITCAVQRWPVSGGAPKAIAVASCESGLWPWAYGSGNYGLFQIRNWPAARSAWLRHRWFPQWLHHGREPGAFKARANAIAAIRWAHSGGWGPWSCA